MMNPIADPLQAIQGLAALGPTFFPLTSRYHGIGVAQLEAGDGTQIPYLRRRFVPQPERFELLQEHVVKQGERLDNITYQHLGDPEQFWRLCDANRAMHPEELTAETGRRLRITLPEGIPGAANA
ncbi:MAG: LysM domain-containing protein [Cyanobacteria bacterium P01_C01_bin.147]